VLSSLSIQNFALIEKLDIDFSDKFSIITGETGAGNPYYWVPSGWFWANVPMWHRSKIKKKNA
jgi:hypothetical protein